MRMMIRQLRSVKTCLGCGFIISYNRVIVKSENEIFANHLQILSYYIPIGSNFGGGNMKLKVSRRVWVFLSGAVFLGIRQIGRMPPSTGELAAAAASWLTVLCAAGLHELGHLTAAWGCGAEVKGLRLDLFGARMELGGLLSYGQEFFVAAGGPFVSLLCAAVAYPLSLRCGGVRWGEFAGVSLLLGLVNLLPVGTLDGGRMLRSGAALLWGDTAATVLLSATTTV
jgi:Zn-dependent protease